MRALTEIESKNELFLNEVGINFVKVLMTQNILSHYIFDATRSIINFLKNEGIHDFDSQNDGEKTYITTHLLTFKREQKIKTSVYKSAKRGDKRMWFGSEIVPITSPNDIIVIMASCQELYILNISHIDIMSCYTSGLDNPVKRFVMKYNKIDE